METPMDLHRNFIQRGTEELLDLGLEDPLIKKSVFHTCVEIGFIRKEEDRLKEIHFQHKDFLIRVFRKKDNTWTLNIHLLTEKGNKETLNSFLREFLDTDSKSKNLLNSRLWRLQTSIDLEEKLKKEKIWK